MPPTGTCVAVGGTGGPVDATAQSQGPAGRGVVVPVARGVPGAAAHLNKVFQINSVACPRANVCLAVGIGANEGAVIPITAGKPRRVRFVPATRDLFAIACSSASSCWATGDARATDAAVVVHITGSIDKVYNQPAFGPPPSSVFKGDNGTGALWCGAHDACLALGGVPSIDPHDPGGPAVLYALNKGKITSGDNAYGVSHLRRRVTFAVLADTPRTPSRPATHAVAGNLSQARMASDRATARWAARARPARPRTAIAELWYHTGPDHLLSPRRQTSTAASSALTLVLQPPTLRGRLTGSRELGLVAAGLVGRGNATT